jgi:hypothetical protein
MNKLRHAFPLIILVLLGYPNCLSAETERIDGKVNIGGVLYPEEDVKDPEIRKKLQMRTEEVRRWIENDKKPRDYSDKPTEELLRMALTYTPSGASYYISKELQKRPEEVRNLILKKLEEAYIPYSVLYRIPYIAGNVDKDFQVEVTKRCFFRRETIEADRSLVIQEDIEGGWYSLIAKSDYDETAVLDRLIADGRMERGSEFELRMRKLFSEGKRSRNEDTERDQKQNNLNSSPIHNKNISFKNTPIIMSFIAASIFLSVSGYLVWRRLRSTN